MDVFELLSEDHRTVDHLFEQIEKTDNRGANHREKLFQKLRQELELHTQLEEKVFYPEMNKRAAMKELVDEALEEHGEVKQMLLAIGSLSADDDQWSEMVNELKMAMQHHVREEENEMFPAARNEVDKHRIDEITTEIMRMKQRAAV